MDELIVQQTDLVEQINKLYINFKKAPKDRITISYVETRLSLLESIYNLFTVTHAKVLAGGKPDTYNDLFDKFMEYYLDLTTLFKETLKSLQPKVNPIVVPTFTGGNSDQQQPQVVAKLPHIPLPTFSGDYSTWVSFRDLFQSLVHDNTSINLVNKCHYLKSSLKGEAEILVKQIPTSDSNYAVIWNKLIQRFENKRSIVNSHLTKLFGLKRLTSESSRNIKELLDATSDCLSSLKDLDVPTDQWDIIVVHMTLSKLDSESHKLFEQTLSDSSVLPTWAQLSKFLEQRFRTLEMLKPKEPHLPQASKQVTPKKVFTSQVDDKAPMNKKVCIYCQEDHYLCHCSKFSALDVESRRKLATEQMLCFNCLRKGHSAYRCLQSTACRVCSRKHHTLLHSSSPNTIQNPQQVSSRYQDTRTSLVTNSRPLETHQETTASLDTLRKQNHSALEPNKDTNTTLGLEKERLNMTSRNLETPHGTNSSLGQARLTLNNHISSCPVLLATALVDVHVHDQVYTLRTLIDQGSQASLITQAACQRLGLNVQVIHGNIFGINAVTAPLTGIVHLDVLSKYETKYKLNVEAFVMKTLTTCLPTQRFTLDWPVLSSLKLADPTFQEPGNIDMILGAEVYACILKDNILRKKDEPLIAQDTYLGWLISGQTIKGQIRRHNNVHVNHVKVEVDATLRRFWEIEDVDINPTRLWTKEEKKCDDHYNTTYERNQDGRYILKLPFASQPPDLGESRVSALKRLYAMERKFRTNPKLEQDYKDFMKDYIEKKHMDLCEQKNKKVCYLPHHAVLSPQHMTTKLRVVFDGSSKTTNEKSLNENLMIGPPLQNDIRNIILRWRRHEVALVADIRQMYRQILVNEDDADYQRIVWRFSTEEPVQDYKLLTVTYGTSCAPYLAIKTLKQLVEDERENFEEDILDAVSDDFYMDDLLTGCSKHEEAKIMKKELTTLLGKGGFPLHKWTSNRKDLRENSEEKSRKILGVKWDINKDAFMLKLEINQDPNQMHTKRTILGDIAKIFDPAGWLSPVVVVAKILLQKLWLHKYDWDQHLDGELLSEYKKYKMELASMPNIELNRWVEQEIQEGDNHKVELHGFSDASILAYSAVVYYRSVTSNGIKVTILEAKTRVAPVKQLSLPRLELCGAVLLAKLLGIAQKSLNVAMDNVYAWTDSSIVLSWLQRHPNCWTTFVANRITEITNVVDKQHWHHVASKDNPADVASRGISPQDLPEHDLWWHGPTWLHEEPIPISSISMNEIEETSVECKIPAHATTHGENLANDPITNKDFDILSRFSTLSKLVRVVSYCFRFFEKCKAKSSGNNYNNPSYLTTRELQHSMNVCVKISQASNFNEEIINLRSGKNVKPKSRIVKLNPYLDENEIIRVGGRISQSTLPNDTKHPIVLSNNEFAELIVQEAHHKTLHGGIQLMSAFIRTKYWILKAKVLIKKCVHRCIKCFRQTAKPVDQLMGDLPKVRVTPSRPFLVSGVDFAGPVTLKLSKGRNVKTQKAYIALFICTAVKAIHLELVTSLDTESFIAAFRRFTGRRGHCKLLLSDCGTNFIGAAKELKIMENQSKIGIPGELLETLENYGTEWLFNPASAPHMGGLWEAGVRCTKHHLKRVLGDVNLTYEEYSTLLCQVEACLNSRPLSVDSSFDNPSEPQAITPGHFLIGEAPITVPDKILETKMSYNNRWIYIQQKLQEFWHRWQSEYLTDLQRRNKWNIVKENLKIGDIVLVKEDRIPPTKWCLGKIVDVHPGSDGKIRVVTLRYKSSTIKRPIHKLCVLPIDVST